MVDASRLKRGTAAAFHVEATLRGVRVGDRTDARRVRAVALEGEAEALATHAILACAMIKGGLVSNVASTRPALLLSDLQRASWYVLNQFFALSDEREGLGAWSIGRGDLLGGHHDVCLSTF
jgi:hypothetical protein